MPPIICLMYHILEENPTCGYSVGFRAFEGQLEWLISRGYTIEGFRELEKRLARLDIPERYVILTFDDGHASALRAAEVLRNVGGQATFFLTKDFCEKRLTCLKPNGIKKVAELCSVGSHGVTHLDLTKLDRAHLLKELSVSRSWLEDLTGESVTALSAPGGNINPQVLTCALENGFTLVGNSLEWWNDRFQMRASRVVNRVHVRSSISPKMFARIMNQDLFFYGSRRVRSTVLKLPKRLLSEAQVNRLAELVPRRERSRLW